MTNASVFISYSHTDRDFVGKLCEILDAQSISYFLDRKDIEWGSRISEDVRNALEHCVAVIVVLSPASLKSQWVPYEVGQVRESKKVLPLLTHPSLDIPGYLGDRNYFRDLSHVAEYFESSAWRAWVNAADNNPAVAQGTRIQRPRSGERVGRRFVVEVNVQGSAVEQHLWIAVEVNDLLWSKKPQPPARNGVHSIIIYEGGDPPNGSFSIVLYNVNHHGNSAIEKWMYDGQRSGGYPGVSPSELAGFQLLDRVGPLQL